jgi:glutamine amidotransferase-like uncharacterized protein
METATLLAIGGGYDLGYIRALKTDGLHNIKTYVERGGSYLGICAGAYLVCRRIEFDSKIEPYVIKQLLRLNLINMRVYGAEYNNIELRLVQYCCTRLHKTSY